MKLRVPDGAAGTRLDRYLASLPAIRSRAIAERLLADRSVRVDGQPSAKSHRLTGGEELELERPADADEHLVAEDVPIRIAYEDQHLLVVDKPSGVVVHPAPGHRTGTLVHGLLAHDVYCDWHESVILAAKFRALTIIDAFPRRGEPSLVDPPGNGIDLDPERRHGEGMNDIRAGGDQPFGEHGQRSHHREHQRCDSTGCERLPAHLFRRQLYGDPALRQHDEYVRSSATDGGLVLTSSRIKTAYAIAVATDVLQFALGPFGWVFVDEILDVVALIGTARLLGFHPLLLPTFVLEFVPFVDVVPTWTACVALVVALRKKQPPMPPGADPTVTIDVKPTSVT